jgi:aryl-alcohol dehydrogenase-like predicted oxidoreductase
MKRNKLGKTNIYISEIGFGSWGIGGLTPGNSSYGKTDDKVSSRSLLTAFEHGINFYDTSNIYGEGNSEILLGKTFNKIRSKVIIATKCGMVNSTGLQDFTINELDKSVYASLKRLQSDYIDLIQLHDFPTTGYIQDEILTFFDSLMSKGIIRAFGISVKNPNDGLSFLDLNFSSIQCNLNLIDQRAVTCNLLNKAYESNISIIARTPLAFGFLTGDFTNKEINLSVGDHRSKWSEEQLRIWADSPLLFSSILDFSQRTMPELALKFCSSFNSVATTIPGMLTEEQVIMNVNAIKKGDLSKDELLKIFDIYDQNIFFAK